MDGGKASRSWNPHKGASPSCPSLLGGSRRKDRVAFVCKLCNQAGSMVTADPPGMSVDRVDMIPRSAKGLWDGEFCSKKRPVLFFAKVDFRGKLEILDTAYI